MSRTFIRWGYLLSLLNEQTVRHKRDKIYEQLAKPGNDYSVYNNKHYPGEIILGEYWVEQVFQDKASGFYALGLVSVSGENPPVLVIRGFGNWGRLEEFPTEFFPYKDIPDVVINESNRHLEAAKKVGVIEWLQGNTLSGMKPDVVGQSLGGKVGQQLTVEVPDYIHSLVTFNSIGISSKEFEKYQGTIEIIHYINPADLVPYVFGEKFLPGIIFQVCNPSIKTRDLLGQHNNLVLDNSLTLIKEVEIETFYRVRALYKSVKDYSKTVEKEVEELRQKAKQELTNCGENLRYLGKTIGQEFYTSRQAIQQEFIKIMQAVRQNLLEDIEGTGSTLLLHKKVNYSVEVIQKEVEKLSQTLQQEIEGSGNTFKSLSQTLQQELKASVGTIQQKLDKFLQR